MISGRSDNKYVWMKYLQRYFATNRLNLFLNRDNQTFWEKMTIDSSSIRYSDAKFLYFEITNGIETLGWITIKCSLQAVGILIMLIIFISTLKHFANCNKFSLRCSSNLKSHAQNHPVTCINIFLPFQNHIHYFRKNT